MKRTLVVAMIVIITFTLFQAFNGVALAKRRSRTIIISPPTITPIESTALFTDNFDRPDGLIADNYGHEDPLGKWDVTSQSFYTKSGYGYTNSPVFRVVTNKSDFENFIINAKVMKKDLGIESWEGIQLFFRYQNPDNLYYAGLRNDNQVHIKKKINGVYTTLAIKPYLSNQLNHWYDLKVVANNGHVALYVDGQKIIEVDDSSISTGKVGIRTDNIEAYFDDYIVMSN